MMMSRVVTRGGQSRCRRQIQCRQFHEPTAWDDLFPSLLPNPINSTNFSPVTTASTYWRNHPKPADTRCLILLTVYAQIWRYLVRQRTARLQLAQQRFLPTFPSRDNDEDCYNLPGIIAERHTIAFSLVVNATCHCLEKMVTIEAASQHQGRREFAFRLQPAPPFLLHGFVGVYSLAIGP